jgi:hypothetical protein
MTVQSGVRAPANLNHVRIALAGVGRSPFWERPSRALPDPEEMCRRVVE